MFWTRYRVLREDEFQRLLKIADDKDLEIRRLNDKMLAMHERVTSTTAEARAKAMMADLLTLRTNVLEREAATARHKATGLPQIAPEIAKGSPLMSSEMGAGFDLMEDAGDARAEEMRARGLLHDQETDPEPTAQPTGAALTDHLGPLN